jgi:hypothetical protein
MTDHPTPTPSSATSTANGLDAVAQACVHIDAAARQLEAAANGDVFSSLLGLAGLLALIRGGINPTLRALADPNDILGPIAHLDRALFLLESAHPSIAPADLLVWTLLVADLRDALPDALLAAWAGRP